MSLWGGVACAFQTFDLRVLHDERRAFLVGDGHVFELDAPGVVDRQAGGRGGDADIFQNDVGDRTLRQAADDPGRSATGGGQIADADVAEDRRGFGDGLSGIIFWRGSFHRIPGGVVHVVAGQRDGGVNVLHGDIANANVLPRAAPAAR